MKEHFTLTRFPNFALAIIIACALVGCATYSKVSERRPRFHPIASAVGRLANAEAAIAKALQLDRSNPLVALDKYMSAAEMALRQFERNPRDENARNDYNFAVARIIGIIRDEKLDPWTQPLRVPASTAISCSRTSPTLARSGIPRSTILRRRISSTSTAPT